MCVAVDQYLIFFKNYNSTQTVAYKSLARHLSGSTAPTSQVHYAKASESRVCVSFDNLMPFKGIFVSATII